MTPLFQSMTDLTEYLEKIEGRIKVLEEENERLRATPPAHPAQSYGAGQVESMDGNVIARYISRSLPQTNLVSPSFFKRAFTVWGHFFVANLIISLFFFILYACLMMVIFGSTFGNLIQSQ